MTDALWPTVPESAPPGFDEGSPPSQPFYTEEVPGLTQARAAMRSGCEAIEADLSERVSSQRYLETLRPPSGSFHAEGVPLHAAAGGNDLCLLMDGADSRVQGPIVHHCLPITDSTPSQPFHAGNSLLPTVDEIIATLDEVRWSVAMDCLHHEKLTEHGRWVLTYASDALRTLTTRPT